MLDPAYPSMAADSIVNGRLPRTTLSTTPQLDALP